MDFVELTADQRESFDHNGYLIVSGAADAGSGVPVAEMEVGQVVGRAGRVERTEMVHRLVEIVDIFGEQGAAAAFEIPPCEEPARLFQQSDQSSLEKRSTPVGWKPLSP